MDGQPKKAEVPRKTRSRTMASRYMQVHSTPAGTSSRASVDRISRAGSVCPPSKSQSRLSSGTVTRKAGDLKPNSQYTPSSEPFSSFKVPRQVKAKVVSREQSSSDAAKPSLRTQAEPLKAEARPSSKKQIGKEIRSFSAPSSPGRFFPSPKHPSRGNSPSEAPTVDGKLRDSHLRDTRRSNSPDYASPSQPASPSGSVPGKHRSVLAQNGVSATPPKAGSHSSVPPSTRSSPDNDFSTPPPKSTPASTMSPSHRLPAVKTYSPNRSSRLSHSRSSLSREFPSSRSAPQSPISNAKPSASESDCFKHLLSHSSMAARQNGIESTPPHTSETASSQSRHAGALATQTKALKDLSKLETDTLLMVMHNRELQWKFANWKATEAAKAQEQHAERQLWESLQILEQLREKVLEREFIAKRLMVIKKAELLLHSHEKNLEEWTTLEPGHAAALKEVLQAMLNTTLRIPLMRGAKADPEALKKAIAELNQVLASLFPAVTTLRRTSEKLAGVMMDLAGTAEGERHSLQECGQLLTDLSHVELHERSLRGHLIQIERENKVEASGI